MTSSCWTCCSQGRQAGAAGVVQDALRDLQGQCAGCTQQLSSASQQLGMLEEQASQASRLSEAAHLKATSLSAALPVLQQLQEACIEAAGCTLRLLQMQEEGDARDELVRAVRVRY